MTAPHQGWYAGIGSRQTPPEILALMTKIGAVMARNGGGLRSGAADGADTAFEEGARAAGGERQIFIPWGGFSDRQPDTDGAINASHLPGAPIALVCAKQHHPMWDRLSVGAKMLHARNVFQVLGPNMADHSKIVICWAKNPTMRNGECVDAAGGTGQAIRIATTYRIPVVNLAIPLHLAKMIFLVESGVIPY